MPWRLGRYYVAQVVVAPHTPYDAELVRRRNTSPKIILARLLYSELTITSQYSQSAIEVQSGFCQPPLGNLVVTYGLIVMVLQCVRLLRNR